jgi:class 3 adenylate cyclase
MASRIPTARVSEIEGAGHLAFGLHGEVIAEEIERFTKEVWEAGGWDDAEPERVLATILFTDIVDSTAKAAELGDRAWRELLERHHAVIRRQLVRFRGAELDIAGDGFFARFDGPARAIRCADAIAKGVRELGIEIRAGLHTGECEVIEGKVGGIAVHIGARIAKEACPGEVLVSSTVKDLVAGSGLRFRERGSAQLKGVPEQWLLFAVEEPEH